MTAAVTMFQ